MPRIYRAMLEEDGKPAVGPTKKTLGTKIRPDKRDDIAADENNLVHPETGGMSVSPNWRSLPVHRIPRRLTAKCRGVAGRDDYVCWRMGDGEFEERLIADKLKLVVDSPGHGTVQPIQSMPAEAYQAAIAATRDEWVVDEQ